MKKERALTAHVKTDYMQQARNALGNKPILQDTNYQVHKTTGEHGEPIARTTTAAAESHGHMYSASMAVGDKLHRPVATAVGKSRERFPISSDDMDIDGSTTQVLKGGTHTYGSQTRAYRKSFEPSGTNRLHSAAPQQSNFMLQKRASRQSKFEPGSGKGPTSNMFTVKNGRLVLNNQLNSQSNIYKV